MKAKKRITQAGPRISDAEWEVMNILWEGGGPMKASAICERLPRERQWAQKTVNTFLARLVEKGALKVKREGRSNVYRAAIAREDCIREAVSDFARRVFRGASGPMLMHFIENESLSEEEIRQLKAMLEDKQG